jgi:preprotein translocase subunit SecE
MLYVKGGRGSSENYITTLQKLSGSECLPVIWNLRPAARSAIVSVLIVVALTRLHVWIFFLLDHISSKSGQNYGPERHDVRHNSLM